MGQEFHVSFFLHDAIFITEGHNDHAPSFLIFLCAQTPGVLKRKKIGFIKMKKKD